MVFMMTLLSVKFSSSKGSFIRIHFIGRMQVNLKIKSQKSFPSCHSLRIIPSTITAYKVKDFLLHLQDLMPTLAGLKMLYIIQLVNLQVQQKEECVELS